VSLRAEGVIAGFGIDGYRIAVQHIAKLLTT
jgi:3-dehydroquinate dehydratase